MTEKVTRIYKAAIKDKEFIKIMFDADGDKKPNFFSDNEDKVCYAMIYYGWLIKKYGVLWKDYI